MTGGATCCSFVLSSRNVTRRRVCSVALLRMFSACNSPSCYLVLRNLVPFGVCTMYERGSVHLATISRTPVVSLFVEDPHALPSIQSGELGTSSLIVVTYHAVSALL